MSDGQKLEGDPTSYNKDHNWLVYNTGRHVSPNTNFMLRVEGLFDLPCRKVHGFTKQNEYEYIQEGGLNDYVHMRRKPASQPFTFQVERYVGVDYIDPLQPGADLILPVLLMVWRGPMYKNFTPFRIYTFTGCTVMSKEYGELNAEQSGLLTETTTIGYRELIRVTAPDGIFDLPKPYEYHKDFADAKDDDKRRAQVHDHKDAERTTRVLWTDNRETYNKNKKDDEPVKTVPDNVRGLGFVNGYFEPKKDEKGNPIIPTNPAKRRFNGFDPVKKTFDSTATKYADHPANDATHATPNRWKGFDATTKTYKSDATPIAARGGDKSKAERRIWKGFVKGRFKKNAKGFALHPAKDALRAKRVEWSGFKRPTKKTRAKHPASDKDRAKLKQWGGIKKPDSGASANHPGDDATHATANKWGGFDPERRTYDASATPIAAHPENDSTHAEPNRWEGFDPDQKTYNPSAAPIAERAENDSTHAEANRWAGFNPDSKTYDAKAKPIAVRPADDATHATVVKWPDTSRRMKVEYLNGGGV